VLHHDRRAFLADVDSADAAADFHDQQAAEFDNLVRLPLAAWRYRPVRRTDDRSAERGAGRRLGAPAIVVRVELSYALRRADSVPSVRTLYWTFVRRGDRVLLAGDDALAQSGGASWRGPWDFGPLNVYRGRASLVLGHADASVLEPIADTVDAAIPAVSAVWSESWSRYVVAVLPGSNDELRALVGLGSSITTDVAAAAIADDPDPESGQIPGQRLIVNPDALARLTPLGRQIVIRHEVTHVAAARATTDTTPAWVREGFAEYVANRGSGQPTRTAATELRADVAAGRLPDHLPTESDFDTGNAVPQAYEEGWLACRLIAERTGTVGLVRFYGLAGQESQAQALGAVLHESTAAFTAQWRGYLRRLLG
jgi:hypothetical protein